MKTYSSVAIIAFVLLCAFNGMAWLSAHYHFWPWHNSLYFFWAEVILIGGLALFFYARHLLVFFLLLIFISYMTGFHDFMFTGELKMPVTFWGLYSLFWLVYFEIRRSPLGLRLRFVHPFFQFLLYLAFMGAAMAGASSLTGYLYYGAFLVPAMQSVLLNQFMAMAIGIPTLTIGILKIIDMIGGRHVFYFLLGTYHRPVEKKRIVLFLDMVGSSAMAEKLPPRKSMEMIARFVFDASLCFRRHGGDIVNYTGDGLMVLWPVQQADPMLKAIDDLISRLEASRQGYQRDFGITPDFRIGIHAGNVVLSQIGEEKLFLGVYGDIVNTAARLEQANKETKTRILLSHAVKQHFSLGRQQRISPMGTIDVRGREGKIDVFTLKHTYI